MDPASRAQPAPLSRLSYFWAGSFCSCPGISRGSDIRGSGAEPLEGRDSVVERSRKDWIIQFKGRRSLFSGGGSKSPELLPKLRLSDLGRKCFAPVQSHPHQALCSGMGTCPSRTQLSTGACWGAVGRADSGSPDLLVALGATWLAAVPVPGAIPLPQVPLLHGSTCSPCVP